VAGTTPDGPPRPAGPAVPSLDETSAGTTTIEDGPRAADADDLPAVADGAADEAPARDRSPRRPVLPLTPVLVVLLVLLLAGCGVLWALRPGTSAVRTDDYVGALQAARAGIVDVTSFDYVTLDDDLEQIRDVTTGDLQKESVDQLDQRRQQITDAQAVVNTTVVGAAVGAADDDAATVFAVLQSTQQTSASTQAQVQRFRVEITLKRVDGRWLLSGITGR
jgi:Mce-associated membrane protein